MNIAAALHADATSRLGSQSVSKRRLLLKLLRAAQPVSRTELAERLRIDKSTVTEIVRPLIDADVIRETKFDSGRQGRQARVLSLVDENGYFIGINLGVRRSQIGLSGLTGEIYGQDEFETPAVAAQALSTVRIKIAEILSSESQKELRLVAVSVPGMTDSARSSLIFAPNLDWRNVPIAEALALPSGIQVVVENDSTAAAMYEARTMIRNTTDGLLTNFVLVRSGTGIGVGLVIGSEVYRGSGAGRGIAGEFGHMTIVARGKLCVCGNRGCWEKYASAGEAASLYRGDRPLRPGETQLRFVDIVGMAEAGERRSLRTLELIGEHLGVGIANVIMGVGIPRVIVSGRLVYGWKFIEGPLRAAIGRSIIGKTEGWSVEPGSPAGAAIGGAIEVAVEEFLSSI